MRKNRLSALLLALTLTLSLLPAGVTQAAGTSGTKKLAWKKTYASFKAGTSRTYTVNKKGAQFLSTNTKVAVIGKTTGKLTAKTYGQTHVVAKLGKEKIVYKVLIQPKKIVGIDPGHQTHANLGTEPIGPGSGTRKIKVAGGTQGVATGLPEYKLTLQVAKKLKTKLEAKGYKVVMTRTKNSVNISNKKRAKKLNKECDIAVRLHADAAGSSARGVSVLYPSKSNPYVGKLSGKSKKLSKSLLKYYCKKTGLKKRGIVKRDDLTGTNWSKIPVALIEMGFMTNASEDRFMASKKGQKKMVNGLVAGIDAYFGY